MSKWQKFINHRRLCFDALEFAVEKEIQEAVQARRNKKNYAIAENYDSDEELDGMVAPGSSAVVTPESAQLEKDSEAYFY